MNRNNSIWKALALVSQIGISMMTPIFLCAFIGYQIDQFFHTQYWFLIFIVLGILAAFRNVYLLTRGFYEKDMKKEHEKLQYFEELKNHKIKSEQTSQKNLTDKKKQK